MYRTALKYGCIYRLIPRFLNTSLNKTIPRLKYSTTSPSIGHKSVSNDMRNEQKIYFTGERKLNEINETNSIDTIKVFAEENIVQINFSDGRIANFNTIWLRDSCDCQQCLHPITKTKLINCADISEQLFVDRIDCSNNTIEIYWRDGGKEEHISKYRSDWLQMFADVFNANPNTVNRSDLNFTLNLPNDGIYSPKVKQIEEVYWDSSLMDKNKFTIDYSDFMQSNEALKKVIQYICQYGVAFLESVPLEEKTILNVARRIAYERITGYGQTFDVKYNPDPKTHLSYTGAKFEPHVDLAYRERSPGIQMLHCLEQASVGGQSFLVDGFRCADILRKSNQHLFELLTKYPVLFTFCDAERGLWFREKWPIIKTEDNNDNNIKEIHYSIFSMRAPIIPTQLLDHFYKAFRDFTELVRSDDNQYKYYMKAGNLVIFNNRRILHGRDQFDHFMYKRHLEGCYLDLDEVKSLYEKLNQL